MATFWYDVCNDYTLQIRMNQNDPSDLAFYIAEERATGEDEYSLTVFIDDEEEEIYLLSSSPDLHNHNLFSV